tara:strand:- start:3308 stop:3550 length:243 start_codon:yes stop_codon:yes gene_type:complete
MNKKEYEGKLAHDNACYLINMARRGHLQQKMAQDILNDLYASKAFSTGRQQHAILEIVKDRDKVAKEKKIKKITKNIENF